MFLNLSFCTEQPSREEKLEREIRKLIHDYGYEACRASLSACGDNTCTTADKQKKDSETIRDLLQSNLAAAVIEDGVADDEDDMDTNGNMAMINQEQAILRTILDASFDAAFLTDALGTILHVNQAAVDLFRVASHRFLIGKNISAIIGGPHAARHASYLKGATQERIQRVLGRMRDVMAKRLGNNHDEEDKEFPVKVGIRRVDGNRFVAFLHDLTWHKKQIQEIEQQKLSLQRSRKVQETILDSSFDSIIVTTEEGIIVQVNQQAVTEFGFSSKEEIVGNNISALVGGGHSRDHDMYMRRFVQRGATSTLLGKLRTLRARKPDGSEFPCQIGIKRVQTTQEQGNNMSDNNHNLMVGYIRNITKELEAKEVEKEKHAAELLLLNMLPEKIALRLKDDPGHIADHYTRATVLFADIVGFTKMSSTMEPLHIVKFLNDLFSRFDNRLEKYGLNKVKTIGDCYMVMSIPSDRDPSELCTAVCYFALELIEQLAHYNQENPGKPLKIRVGINHGPAVAGIVGTKRFLYDVWGDTVNIASRMESTGTPGKIQVTKAVLDSVANDEFEFEERGAVQVKGIGEMSTFFLLNCKKAGQAKKYWQKIYPQKATLAVEDSEEELSTVELLSQSLRRLDLGDIDPRKLIDPPNQSFMESWSERDSEN